MVEIIKKKRRAKKEEGSSKKRQKKTSQSTEIDKFLHLPLLFGMFLPQYQLKMTVIVRRGATFKIILHRLKQVS